MFVMHLSLSAGRGRDSNLQTALRTFIFYNLEIELKILELRSYLFYFFS